MQIGWLFCVLFAALAVAQPPLQLKRGQPGRSAAGAETLRRRHLGRKHWIVQFGDQPTPAQLLDLGRRGGQILSYIPKFGYSISAPDDIQFQGLALNWAGQLTVADKLSAELSDDATQYVIVEFYSDVDMDDARAIVLSQQLQVQDNPDLVGNQLLVHGATNDLAGLAAWDEVAYIFPAANEVVQGVPMHGCVGALTTQGQVTQVVPIIGGWPVGPAGTVNLNYAFVNTMPNLPTDQVASEIARAFAEWSKYVNVTYTPSSDTTADRTVAILFGSGDHGDAYPFTSAILAHTFYPFPVNPEPIAGNMHFNADQNWNIGSDVDVFSVALHEAGHTLGLGHSDVPGTVMYPYYQKNTALSAADIAAAQQLYPARGGVSSTPSPAPSPAPSPLVITAVPPSASTTNSSLLVQGTVSGGSGAIQVSWTTNQGLSGVATGGTNWTAGPIPLNIGANTITITAQDATGAKAAQTFTIARQSSTTPVPNPPSTPQLSITAPCSGACTSSVATIAVSGTASDASGIARVTWLSSSGQGAQASGTTAWSTGPVTLQSSLNSFTITAYAQSGAIANETLQITYTPQPTGVDTSPPSLTILSPLITTVTTSASTIAFNGTARDNAGIASVTWTNSNGGSGIATGSTNWSVAAIPLLVGTNTITIRATNTGGFTAWRSVVVTRY